jgi:hypothetical protein
MFQVVVLVDVSEALKERVARYEKKSATPILQFILQLIIILNLHLIIS